MKYVENEKFDYLIRLALLDCGEKDAEMFRTIDTSNVVVSPRLRNKIHRLIRRKARENAVKKTRLVFGRIAVAAMLVLSIMFATMMSISAIREAVWKTIVEWHDNYIAIRYESPEDDGKDNVSTNQTDVNGGNAAVTPPTEILEVRKPTYLPEGVVEDVVVSAKSMVMIDYYLGEELIYSFDQNILKTNDRYYNNKTAVVKDILVKENKAIVVTYEQTPEVYLIWHDGEYSYVLVSITASLEDMIKIAESVK